MPHPSVYVVVVNYNGLQHNGPCLRSVLAQDYPDLHVLLVDNGSTDSSVEAVRDEFGDRVKILLNGQNLLYAAGANRGFHHALSLGADYLFLINNDIVLEEGCISRLVAFMTARPEAGGCQPLVCALGPGHAIKPEVLSAGINISLSGRCWDVGRGASPTALGTSPAEVAGCTGAALFVPASVVRKVGDISELYGIYFEDTDYSLRIRRAGYPLFLVPDARVGHAETATVAICMPKGRLMRCETNAYRLVLDHFPDGLRRRGLLVSAIFTVGSCLRNLLRGKPATAAALLIGGGKGLALIARKQSRGTGPREPLRSHIRAETWFPPKP